MEQSFATDRRGQLAAGVAVGLITLAVVVFVVTAVWQQGSTNCQTQGNPDNQYYLHAECTTNHGLFSTVTGTMLPLLAVGIVAALLLFLFRSG